MIVLSKYIEKLEQIKTKNKTSLGLIAKYLLNNLDSKIEITEARQIAYEVGVSNAMISKFCVQMNYKNIHEILFLQRLVKEFDNEQKPQNIKELFKQAGVLIEKSRKIFFVGVSNGFIVNQDFARKINRIDKWTYVSDNKYEQIGNSRLLVTQDLLIVTSVSLQHPWMHEIIKSTLAKVILISSNLPKELINKVTIFFSVSPDTVDPIHRNVTYNPRIDVLKIFDQIYYELILRPQNKLLLKTTRYNKN